MKLVVLSGAGISAESGIPTFRDAGGLWEGHDVMQVASPEGWAADFELVLDFYNQRRRQAKNAEPNDGHQELAALEQYFDVSIVTQNVDNLHERAGSRHVLHLHGTLFESRSTLDENLTYPVEGDISPGDVCEKGSQLRPNIVWFGEMVPNMEQAITLALEADAFIVVGTSMNVHPAAGLIEYVPADAPRYIVDPNQEIYSGQNLTHIYAGAGIGLKQVSEELKARFL